MARIHAIELDSMMRNHTIRAALRGSMAVVGIAVIALGVAFWMHAPGAIALWPWKDGKLSYLFIASILMTAGASFCWTAYSMNLNAVRGGALGMLAMDAGIAAYMAYLYSQRHQFLLLEWVIVNLLLCVSSLALFIIGGREPQHEPRRLHWWVRGSFLVFTLAFFAVASMLVARAPIVFPWKLNPDSSVIFGCFFLCAGIYSLDIYRRPGVENAKGQLLGFVVYDLVLIPPYLQHWPNTKGGFRISLIVYLSVLVASAAIAIWVWLNDLASRGSAGPAARSGRASAR
jgi:hypothetical protein